jgi:hypothetical protein
MVVFVVGIRGECGVVRLVGVRIVGERLIKGEYKLIYEAAFSPGSGWLLFLLLFWDWRLPWLPW